MRNDGQASAVVVGAGAWGTALAITCVRAGLETTLWCRSHEQAHALRSERENTTYLKGHPLPTDLTISNDVECIAAASIVILAVPAQATRTVVSELAETIATGSALIVTAKGLERGTDSFLVDVVNQEIKDCPVFVLSGPSFAADVAKGLPTAVTLGGRNVNAVQDLAALLSTNAFRIYAAGDVAGVQIGGAVKNVLAIAAGICTGKGFGPSAHAALVARSFSELRRLANVLGADEETLFGLSGLGDLILTCSSEQSRNYSLGIRLGKGDALHDILSSRVAVSEGVHTAPVVAGLAKSHAIEMPVCEAVERILSGASDADTEIIRLLSRPLRHESERSSRSINE